MIHNIRSKKLIKKTVQLNNNYEAYKKLVNKIRTTRTSTHYKTFSTEIARQAELERLHAVGARILRMREALLVDIGTLTMAEQKRTVHARNLYDIQVTDPQHVEA